MKIKLFVFGATTDKYLEEIYENYPEVSFIKGLRDILANRDEAVFGIITGNCFFERFENPLSESYLKKVFEQYDVVIPYYGRVKEGSTYKLYGSISDIRHLDFIRAYIEKEQGDMLKACDYIYNAQIFSFADSVIARREVFSGFLGFAEKVLEAVNHSFDNVDEKLLISWLLRIYIAGKPFRVKEEHILKTPYSMFVNLNEKIELTRKYMSIRLKDLIEYRKTNGFTEPLAAFTDSDDDFEGKEPVFICWWQGIEEAPDMVKACIKSVERSLPKEKFCIRLITFENVGRYAGFTEAIVNKFNSGLITYTHLSDILRAELLYRYGGLWIDATYYFSKPLPKDFFDGTELFSIAFKEPLWGLDIMKARWTASFLYAKKGNRAMQFLMEGLWQYWEQEDKLIDYFTVDYVLDAGYRAFPEIKEEIDNIKRGSDYVYSLQLRMNEKYTEREEKKIPGESYYYKLNRRNEYFPYNQYGELTVYGHILEEAGIIFPPENKKKAEKSDNALNEFLNMIRERNLTYIDDKEMLLAGQGSISRLTIPDIIADNVTLKGYNLERYPDVVKAIYDGSPSQL